MGRTLIAVISDTHFGSSVGLAPRSQVPLDDGGYYTPSKAQNWLYDLWEEFWAEVDLRKRDVDRWGIIMNGDTFDGDHHGTAQIVSRHPGVEKMIGCMCWETPLALDPEFVVATRGTGAHVGKSSSTDDGFARWIKKEGFAVIQEPETGHHAWWLFQGLERGVKINVAHHGRSPGGRPWTTPTGVHRHAADIWMQHAENGERPPDLAIRSHYHRHADSWWHKNRTRLIQTPAWQLMTEYGYRRYTDSLADIGGLIVEISDGDVARDQIDVTEVITRPKRGAVVQL